MSLWTAVAEYIKKVPFNEDVLWCTAFIVLLWSLSVWFFDPSIMGGIFLLALSIVIVLMGRNFFIRYKKKKEGKNYREKILNN